MSESTAMVAARDRTPIIAGATPEKILANATEVANALKGLIDERGLSRKIGKSEHVEVSGWQAMGALLGAFGGQPLHAETAWSRPLERDGALVWEACVEIRTLSGDLVGSAEAMCSTAESNWRGRDEFAVRSMAETRAEGRAYRRAAGWLASLAGYAPAAAEEIPDDREQPGAAAAPAKLPAWAEPADVAQVAQDLVVLLQSVDRADGDTVARIGESIFERCGKTIPVAVAEVIATLRETIAGPQESASAAQPADPVGAPQEDTAEPQRVPERST